MKERAHENKTKKCLVSCHSKKDISAVETFRIHTWAANGAGNCSQNTLKLRNCRLIKMDLKTERILT